MPVIFAGHGSPVNALGGNEFSEEWKRIGRSIPRPRAILCISAHWETSGTHVTALERPRTIHDFYGFPEALYQIDYPAPGSPALASELTQLHQEGTISADHQWGFDHGTWSILLHMFPQADIPVLQLSLDYSLNAQAHYDLARQLASLRNRGVLILGSGNLVHNLRLVNWRNPQDAFPWALEVQDKFDTLILQGRHRELANYGALGKEVQMAVPTPEHYLPALYILALQDKNDKITFFNNKTVMGSVSMTSFIIQSSIN